LGATKTLTATIPHSIHPLGQIPIWNVWALGSGIDEGGDIVQLPEFGHLRDANLPSIGSITEDQQQGRTMIDRRLHLSQGLYFHKLDPCHSHGMIVNVSVTLLHHDFVGHTRCIGKSGHLLWIGTGNTCGRNLTQSCGAAIGDHPPLALHELGNAVPDRVVQFIEMNVALGSLHHSGPNLRQHH
jgi:hypothetical protein